MDEEVLREIIHQAVTKIADNVNEQIKQGKPVQFGVLPIRTREELFWAEWVANDRLPSLEIR